MKRILSLTAGGLTLLLIGSLLNRRADERAVRDPIAPLSPSATPTEGSADLRRMSHELSNMQRELTRMRSQVAEQHPQPDEDDSPQALSDTPRVSEHESWSAKMEEVSSAFQQEPLNATWAGRMSATLRQAVQESDALGGALRSIECRSRSCRVEIVGAHDANVQQGLTTFLMHVAGVLPNMRAEPPDDNRPGVTVMYLEG